MSRDELWVWVIHEFNQNPSCSQFRKVVKSYKHSLPDQPLPVMDFLAAELCPDYLEGPILQVFLFANSLPITVRVQCLLEQK